jgi:hypothetical protein
MVPPVSDEDLDGVNERRTYPDGTLVRVFVLKTDEEAYPSGWGYTLHYGATEPTPDTLDDGTIRRYDNAHEDTKGHELHAAPDPEPKPIEFPGMVELWNRFWSEIPNDEFDIS